ncbi:dormancy-associated protein homolog 3-like isoform X2 [Papaver somniferum]|uniref:dormancy-associated protein homolog 3-like isoform X2 n=1 Tax=Papaver somniferum TaxID=3469 RepID=UPI000E6FB5A6|nr:dormancy-associated protein homolog 3-like isoform X2 [Papaver somniferum]
MGLLDQLWDDTVAGPTPETGLGKLRKHSTFSFRSNSGNKEVESVARSNSEDLSDEVHRNVTRSIMILKPRPGNLTINGNDGGGSSAPASPAGSTPPVSPFTPSGSPFSDYRRMFTREERLPRHQQQSPSEQQQQQQQQWGMDPGVHLLLTTCEM